MEERSVGLAAVASTKQSKAENVVRMVTTCFETLAGWKLKCDGSWR